MKIIVVLFPWQGTFIISLVRYKPLKFNKTYVYPTWAYALGWCLGLFCVLLVPLWMIFKLTQMKGTIGEVCTQWRKIQFITNNMTKTCNINLYVMWSNLSINRKLAKNAPLMWIFARFLSFIWQLSEIASGFDQLVRQKLNRIWALGNSLVHFFSLFWNI